MDNLLDGKVALVIGAGRGLGRVVATELARHGAAVAVAARSDHELAETVRLIHDLGGNAIAFTVDVSSPDQVETMKKSIDRELGTVSILVNAAGIFGPIQPIGEDDPTKWIQTIMINSIGPYLTCRAFVPGMRSLGWGRIVNFSSAASLHPPGPLNSAYGTSKVALNQFTRHLAAELIGSGVTANVIHPGEVKTAMWAAIRDESQQAGTAGEPYRAWAENVGLSGGDDPQMAAELVLRIVCETTQEPVNGKFLWIDGGIQIPIASW